MTIVVTAASNPTVDGNSIEIGDEIGVVNDKGECYGATTWNGSNVAISIWGDNDLTDKIDGFKSGAPLFFKVWSLKEKRVFDATVEFDNRSGIQNATYLSDGMGVISRLTAK